MNQSHLSSYTLLPSLNQQAEQFDYSVLEPSVQTLVLQNTSEIKTLMQRTCQDIINIGKKLTETKKSLGHGKFISWLKFEFSWSVSTATKFMQVSEQFKFINFTNLDITASALYLIAAPSTPDEARSEVLQLASNGEKISYTKAKQIICQSKNKNLGANYEPITKISSAKGDYCKIIETVKEKVQEIEQSHDLQPLSAINQANEEAINKSSFIYQDYSPLMYYDYDKESTIRTSMFNNFTFEPESNAIISEIATQIQNLTPEQLALVVVESAKSGLSSNHLNSIITVSSQILKDRQILDGAD